MIWLGTSMIETLRLLRSAWIVSAGIAASCPACWMTSTPPFSSSSRRVEALGMIR